MMYKLLIFIFYIAITLVLAKSFVFSQDITASIKISETSVFIEGKILTKDFGLNNKNWSFLENYADADSLGVRISNFKLFDKNGQIIDYKQLVAGEFEATAIAESFSYTIKTDIPEKLTSTAHVSWLTKTHGLLMFSDIFPQWQKSDKSQISINISFVLPVGWRVFGNELKESETSFLSKDLTKTIFLVGNNIREKRAWLGKNELNLAIIGDWNFSDDFANQSASSILQEHKRTFGEYADKKSQIFLLPFPKGEYTDNWRAETRGTTVTVVSGVLPFKSLAEQRLNEQLRHELFHFWLPNNLALSGNYDWFYEGFTIYQGLRSGLQLNQIRFEDYLNTISQTYRSANNFDNGKLSLIEASQNRWTISTQTIYTKGLIVAFLCDLAILKESKGKKSLTEVFRQLWKKHKIPNRVEDGNAAIQKMFEDFPETNEIYNNYVSGKSRLEFQNELSFFGLEYKKSENKISVVENLDGKQKDLLDKLGYNQWRKLLEKQK